MPRMTLDELRKVRDKKQFEMGLRESGGSSTRLVVSMGTSGIAAGAKKTLAALVEALEEQNLTDIPVRQTGSMGLESMEPIVEVHKEGMPTVIYGRVDDAVAREIVQVHLKEGRLLDGHIVDRPAADIQGGQ
ncbi:MAG: (2Fe-2S) ferredoxin domain-containing protein [Spirochaetaceae bacterium]|nr:MAG: (2Fe-2S) ferredoxin domain-containing protein [Spirochaetaceae bacterium]